jgi:hypothetical protein
VLAAFALVCIVRAAGSCTINRVSPHSHGPLTTPVFWNLYLYLTFNYWHLPHPLLRLEFPFNGNGVLESYGDPASLSFTPLPCNNCSKDWKKPLGTGVSYIPAVSAVTPQQHSGGHISHAYATCCYTAACGQGLLRSLAWTFTVAPATACCCRTTPRRSGTSTGSCQATLWQRQW